jgi:hypothetical protein
MTRATSSGFAKAQGLVRIFLKKSADRPGSRGNHRKQPVFRHFPPATPRNPFTKNKIRRAIPNSVGLFDETLRLPGETLTLPAKKQGFSMKH